MNITPNGDYLFFEIIYIKYISSTYHCGENKMNSMFNSVSKKIKENETIIEYSLILTVESCLAIVVIHNMYNLLLSMMS
jgi:hypothetical protein